MTNVMRRVYNGQSTRRLFTIYAIVSLVPVLVLGLVLMRLLANQSDQQGLAEGTKAASLVQRTAIAPVLQDVDLRHGLTPIERTALDDNASKIVQNGQVVRLRLRDLDGNIVYAYGGGVVNGPVDDDAIDAAHGKVTAELSHLNSDETTSSTGRGPRVVEVYAPLNSAQSGRRIGVVEMYLPYAPIAADISAGQQAVTMTLSLGLLAVWAALLAVSISVTRRLRREAKVNAMLANNDALTGLPNRGRFHGLIDERLGGVTRQRRLAVAVLDIDRFREINDTLGHDNGDRLIIILAKRLSDRLRDSDLVARIGGDEFGIVISDVGDGTDGMDGVSDALGRLRKAISEPIEIGGLPVAIEASIGYAVAPVDGMDAGRLIQRADVALYVAKDQHLGVVAYSADHDHYSSAALRLVAELATAIDDGQLVLHYQPKVNLATDEIESVEALVRWNHPTRGLLYPDAFLPAVEQTELIEPLTWWVLRNASLDLAQLDPTGQLTVAVNISARSLVRSDFADDLLAVLAGTGTDPRRVVLEVTETELLTDPPRATATLRRLHEAGFVVSIDDFGAGQTSLSYLAMLPIGELKIDKSFVFAMTSNERNAAIVRSVIELGHSLGLSVTAEGVETVEAQEQLRLYDCDTVQGYYVSKPLPLAVLAQRLRFPSVSRSRSGGLGRDDAHASAATAPR
jgi:diguanylate cyclase (GGDEF)-like protein